MKTTMTKPFVQIDAEDLKKYSPVNETLSADFTFSTPAIKHRVFSTTDLWKLRRQRRMQGLVIR